MPKQLLLSSSSFSLSLPLTFLFLLVVFAFFGCQQSKDGNRGGDPSGSEENPAAEGFNTKASDPQAIAVADSVMKAMGGRKNWDATRIISWNFFGNRTHTWDKKSGRDRIEIPADSIVIDFELNSREGTVTKNGEKMTQPDSVSKYLQKGYEMWVNDSYWLIMPYKLKDSGVTLKYMGIENTDAGNPAHKLQLTFDKVGVTPQNKYHVYVDTTEHLVRQWKYFPKADMQEPGFSLPWKDYQQYGKILLSGNRGKYTLSDIKVTDEWPEGE